LMSVGSNFLTSSKVVLLFYQGANSSFNFGFFGAASVCVPPGYNADTFGNQSVTSDAPICKSFRSMFDNCSKGSYVNGQVVKERRRVAREWEDQTNGCVEYRCDNETGLVSWSNCNSTSETTWICVNEQCIEKNQKTSNEVAIEIELEEGVSIDEVNTTSIADVLSTRLGIDANKLTIGWTNDDERNILSVIIYVKNDDIAQVIYDALDKIERSGQCEFGILCVKKTVHIIPKYQELSEAYRNNMTICAKTLMILFIITHLCNVLV